MNTQLPEIKVVRHLRAKRLRLIVSSNGIRLTAPPLISMNQIQKFIDSNQTWLLETWGKYYIDSKQSQQIELPTTLNFCYGEGDTIHIQYVAQKAVFKFDSESCILFVNEDRSAKALTQFVCQYAQQILPNQLKDYARLHQLSVSAVRIAKPRSRWGSCSGDQKIMLHAGLLLMPKHYAHYVILHELAHTKHMNHQAIFWELLEKLYPNAKQVQKHVRKFRLPPWWQPK